MPWGWRSTLRSSTAAFFAISAGFTFIVNAVFGDFETSSAPALALGTVTFLTILTVYLLFFWTLAGQTLGMRLLGIRLIDFHGDPHLAMRTAVRRLFGVVLSVLTLGIGFLWSCSPTAGGDSWTGWRTPR